VKKPVTLALLLGATWPLLAATFNVSPIRVGLSAQRPIVPLSVRNEGDEPMVVQVQTVRWSQQNGQDVYEPTNDILATPPIVTVPPRGTQIVRVGLRRSVDPARELSYRVYLAEVPAPPAADATRVHVALRIGLPVFVSSPTPSRPLLDWTLAPSAEGEAILRVKNEGNAHAQLANVRLLSGTDRQALARYPSPAYVLPGSAQEWLLKLEPGKRLGADPVRLQAFMDAGDVDVDITPQAAD
jgi:fimbrial chaperone protein